MRLSTPLPPALALLVVLASPATGAGTSAWSRTAARFAGIDTLQRAGAWHAAESGLDSLAALARARHDRGMELAALVRTARGRTTARSPDDATSLLVPVLGEISARHDTLLLCRALLVLAADGDAHARWTDALVRYRRVARLAALAGLASEKGIAWSGIGDHAIEENHTAEAVRAYRRALRSLRGPGDRRARVRAQAGLARSMQVSGDVDGAREVHAGVLAEAIALGDRNLVANTEFNLGSLEQMSGDPTRAPPHFEAAAEIARELGRRDLVLRVAQALAVEYMKFGRTPEADSALTRVLPEAERSPNLPARAMLLSQFGVLRRKQGRFAEGVEYGRRSVALSDSLPIAVAMQVTVTLAATFAQAGRPEDALVLYRTQAGRLEPRMDAPSRLSFGRQEAVALLRLGRPLEALALLRPAIGARRPRGNDEEYLLGLVTEARCRSALGERDSTLAAYARAATYWERLRIAQPDPAWRERADNMTAEFAAAFGIALLGPRRGIGPATCEREAFETLQRFRARTLAERVRASDPAAAAGVLPSLAEFRRLGLRPGELFLDVYPGTDTTVVFAVTRDTLVAWRLPPSSGLADRLLRLRSLVSDPAAGAADLGAQVAASLGAEILGPAAAEIRRARRVLIAAGSLVQFPLGYLVVPGGREPLVREHELAFLPSAALLLRARGTAPPGVPADRTLLAVAFTRDAEGHTIPDASREVRWLEESFAGAAARVDDWGRSPAALCASFTGYGGLHFATHMRENVWRPWQSAMFVGGAHGRPAWLSAAEISGLHVNARLCVLAGCRSLGGQGLARETLQGLSTAWLAAGVRTVVATQWDADDESTRALVRAFYQELAAGRTAAEALRTAQAATRRTPQWSAPCFWAGFVLLGDPESRLALVPRHGIRQGPRAR